MEGRPGGRPKLQPPLYRSLVGETGRHWFWWAHLAGVDRGKGKQTDGGVGYQGNSWG